MEIAWEILDLTLTKQFPPRFYHRRALLAEIANPFRRLKGRAAALQGEGRPAHSLAGLESRSEGQASPGPACASAGLSGPLFSSSF